MYFNSFTRFSGYRTKKIYRIATRDPPIPSTLEKTNGSVKHEGICRKQQICNNGYKNQDVPTLAKLPYVARLP